MNGEEMPKIPVAQVVYGEIIYWFTIVACIICTIGPVIAVSFPDNNVLNPHYLFAAIFEGKDAATIWDQVGGGFPGGHFYFKNFLKGDGFTQFGLALGCSCAVWGLLAASFAYVRDRIYVYVFLGLWVAMLVALSMLGIVKGH